MIYLASPYTDESESVMDLRYVYAMKLASHLLKKDYKVISPIVMFHNMAVVYGLPRDFTFWEEMDEDLIMSSEGVFIAKIDGWKNSAGMKNDWRLAKKHDKPIHVVEYNHDTGDTTETHTHENPWGYPWNKAGGK